MEIWTNSTISFMVSLAETSPCSLTCASPDHSAFESHKCVPSSGSLWTRADTDSAVLRRCPANSNRHRPTHAASGTAASHIARRSASNAVDRSMNSVAWSAVVSQRLIPRAQENELASVASGGVPGRSACRSAAPTDRTGCLD